MNIHAECARAWVTVSADSRIEGKLAPYRDGFHIVLDCESDDGVQLVFEPATLRRFLTVAEPLLARAESGA